jgi:hypothetical protein
MAKRKKLYGAALAAHQKKARRNAPVTPKTLKRVGKKVRVHGKKGVIKTRTVHIVKRYKRKGGPVAAYRRKGGSVPRHISNPRPRRSYRRYRRNPFGGGLLNDAKEGLMAAGVILGTLWLAGVVNRQLNKVPMLAIGWPNVLGKLAVALGVGAVASKFMPQGLQKYNSVVYGAAFVPALLSGVAQVSPMAAAQLTLAGDAGMGADLQAQLDMQVGGMPQTRVSDYTMSEGEQDSDSSSF